MTKFEMYAGVAGLLAMTLEIARAAQPPRVLQIYRERLKPGSVGEYSAIEESTARISAALGCPHPYLGMESLTGPKEVWWLNGMNPPSNRNKSLNSTQKTPV